MDQLIEVARAARDVIVLSEGYSDYKYRAWCFLGEYDKSGPHMLAVGNAVIDGSDLWFTQHRSPWPRYCSAFCRVGFGHRCPRPSRARTRSTETARTGTHRFSAPRPVTTNHPGSDGRPQSFVRRYSPPCHVRATGPGYRRTSRVTGVSPRPAQTQSAPSLIHICKVVFD